MTLERVYLSLCVVGIVLPYTALIPWFSQHGLSPSLLLAAAFESHISAFAWLDVLVSAVVLIVFVIAEGRRLSIPHLWMPVVATLTVGVSLGLPLFLYQRERLLNSSANHLQESKPIA